MDNRDSAQNVTQPITDNIVPTDSPDISEPSLPPPPPAAFPGHFPPVPPKKLGLIDPLNNGKLPASPSFYLGIWNPSTMTRMGSTLMLCSLAFFSWLITALGGGIMGVLIVAWIFVDYWDGLCEKLENQLRIEANYRAIKRRLQLGSEEADWFNYVLARFWLVYEPTLSQTIQASLDPILEWVCPGFIDSMTFAHFTLGTFPPQIRSIISSKFVSDDIVDLQLDVVLGHFSDSSVTTPFPSNEAEADDSNVQDEADPKQPLNGSIVPASTTSTVNTNNAQISTINGINSNNVPSNPASPEVNKSPSTTDSPKMFREESVPDLLGENQPSKASENLSEIKLNSRIDFVVRMKGLSILIRAGNIQFEGQLRVRMKLMTAFPHVKILEIWFTDVPRLDFNLKPLGALDLKAVSAVHNKIKETIAWALKTYLVDNPLVLPFDDWFNNPSAVTDSSQGVLAIHILNATGLKNTELIGKSDPFVRVLMNGALMAQTAVINNNLNPFWDEVKYIPVAQISDINFRLEVCDFDKAFSNKALGFMDLDLSQLDSVKGGSLPITEHPLTDTDRKQHGKLRLSVAYHPVAPPAVDLASTAEQLMIHSGLLRITIHAAKALEPTSKLRSPLVYVSLNGEFTHRTRVKKHSNAPLWEESFEIFVSDYKTAKLNFSVRDDAAAVSKLVSAADTNLGETTISVVQALKKDSKDDWYTLNNGVSREAKLRLTLRWRPVPLVYGAGASFSGVLRVRINACYELKSLATTKCSPYVKLLTSGKTKAQTRQITDQTNPEFQESIFVLVKDMSESVCLEVWDHHRAIKDSLIGRAALELKRYMAVNAESGVLEAKGKSPQLDELRLLHPDHAKQRGRIAIEVSYHPKLPALLPSVDVKSLCGILRVNVHQMKDLPRKTNVFFEIVGDDILLRLFKSNTRKKTSEPIFEQNLEIFVRQVYMSTFHLILREDREATGAVAETISGAKAVTGAMTGVVSGAVGTITGSRAAPGGAVTSGQKLHPIVASLDAYVFDLYNKKEEKWYEMTNGVRARLSFDFRPVDCNIDVSESLENMGMFHVEIVSGREFPSMDRNGKCDPFCIIYLNEERCHRTAVQKKTLNPVWKERFKVPVINRNRSTLRIEIFDWDRVTENERISGAELNLSEIKINSQQTVDLPFTDRPCGVITISYRFDAQRMDKIPSKSFSLNKATLERLDPRKLMLSNSRFSFSAANANGGAKSTADSSLMGMSTANMSNISLLPSEAREDIKDGDPKVGDSNEALSLSASVDFGSNSSLCTFCGDNTDKVRERGAVAITVVEARDVLALDRDGSSDPYVKIRCHASSHFSSVVKKFKYETKVISNELNPAWEQTFTTVLPKGLLQFSGQIDPLILQFSIWDANKIASNTEIGRFEFDLWDALFERIAHKKVISEPGGTGWHYVKQDLWLIINLNETAVSLAARRNRSQIEVDTVSGKITMPRLHVHLAALVPPGFIKIPHAPRPFPAGMTVNVDETWVEQVAFPVSLFSHPQLITPTVPDFAFSVSGERNSMDNNDGDSLPGSPRGRLGSALSDASSTTGHKISKLTDGFKKAFLRSKSSTALDKSPVTE
jgi:Ca2+-dependent lipid-binding protein